MVSPEKCPRTRHQAPLLTCRPLHLHCRGRAAGELRMAFRTTVLLCFSGVGFAGAAGGVHGAALGNFRGRLLPRFATRRKLWRNGPGYDGGRRCRLLFFWTANAPFWVAVLGPVTDGAGAF